MVKSKTCLWYFCGQRKNRRGKTTAISIWADPRRIELPNLSDADSGSKFFLLICTYLFSLLMQYVVSRGSLYPQAGQDLHYKTIEKERPQAEGVEI